MYKIRIQALLNGDIPSFRPTVLDTEFETVDEVKKGITFLEKVWNERGLKPYSVLLQFPDDAGGGKGRTYYDWAWALTPAEAVASAKKKVGGLRDVEPEEFHCLAVIEGHVAIIGDDRLGGY